MTYTRPNKSTKIVVGIVSQTCNNQVLFETEEPLQYDIKWRMQFKPNRIPIRMEYQALEIVKQQELSSFFFPSKAEQKSKQFDR